MYLSDVIQRSPAPEPWAEGGKIPWNDPDFSRRTFVIEDQIEWIIPAVLHNRSSRVLDLGCGPGLYSSRLAQRGHSCVGIDFSPASIEYARASAQSQQLACEYRLEQGLFSDRPHVYLFESFWHEAQAVATERFYIIDAETSEVTQHSASTQAYTDEQYRRMVQDAGFTDTTFYSSLIGQPDERQKDLVAIVARKEVA